MSQVAWERVMVAALSVMALSVLFGVWGAISPELVAQLFVTAVVVLCVAACFAIAKAESR